eukprot:scaffold1308_cov93-Cylindrotheca_fusiformis.AAC.1
MLLGPVRYRHRLRFSIGRNASRQKVAYCSDSSLSLVMAEATRFAALDRSPFAYYLRKSESFVRNSDNLEGYI